MLTRKVLIAFGLGLILLYAAGTARAGLSDLLKGIQDSILGRQSLSEAQITRGLKEALQVGTRNAIKNVAKRNGYYGNPDIKVPLPQTLQQIAPVMRAVGLKSRLVEFEKSMNRAAERAAPQAATLFGRAIRKMSITDAVHILDGPDDAATRYFKDKTWTDLKRIFKPEVARMMTKVGVTRMYKDLNRQMRRYPYLDTVTIDLDAYVTEKALQGLFVMLAREEKEIRHNPQARVTDLLKKVFAS